MDTKHLGPQAGSVQNESASLLEAWSNPLNPGFEPLPCIMGARNNDSGSPGAFSGCGMMQQSVIRPAQGRSVGQVSRGTFWPRLSPKSRNQLNFRQE